VEYALKATNQKSAIQLLDQGTRYCLQLKQPINLQNEVRKVGFKKVKP
jgi:hypothetical protein